MSLLSRWQRVTPRERWLVITMVVCVLGALIFSLMWQPMAQRLTSSQRQYQQQLALATQLQRAKPPSVSAPDAGQPLSLRVSESAAAANLELQQMDTDGDDLRVILSGDAKALLAWLDHLEREGAHLQSLTLEKRDNQLWVRVVIR